MKNGSFVTILLKATQLHREAKDDDDDGDEDPCLR